MYQMRHRVALLGLSLVVGMARSTHHREAGQGSCQVAEKGADQTLLHQAVLRECLLAAEVEG